MLFTIKVSRKFWPWPKKYKCKGIIWCNPEKHDIPTGFVQLILEDDSKVFIDVSGKIITYSPEFIKLQEESKKNMLGESN